MRSKTWTLLTLFAVLLGVLACGGGATPTPAAAPMEATPQPTATFRPTPSPQPPADHDGRLTLLPPHDDDGDQSHEVQQKAHPGTVKPRSKVIIVVARCWKCSRGSRGETSI